MLQLQGALAFQRLAGGGITTVVLGALALLLDPALLFLAGNAIALFGTIARLGDPVGDQRLLAAPVLARPILAGTGVTLAVRGGLALLRETPFAVLPLEALLFAAAPGSRGTLLGRRALRGRALFGGLSSGLLLPLGELAAFGGLTILALANLLLVDLGRALLLCTLTRHSRALALLRNVVLTYLQGARLGLRGGSMILSLRRFLALAVLVCLDLALVVLLLVLVARILARVGRGIEAGGQQGAEHGGQQGAVGNEVHGKPSVAGRKQLLARGALHVKST
jgi:hypothetical protein